MPSDRRPVHPRFYTGLPVRPPGEISHAGARAAQQSAAPAVKMIAVVFPVPVAFPELPAPVVVVIMRMRPERSRVWRSHPSSRNPHIPSAHPVPIAVRPDVLWSWHRRPYLVAQRRRCRSNINTDLPQHWYRRAHRQNRRCYPFRLHRNRPFRMPASRAAPGLSDSV